MKIGLLDIVLIITLLYLIFTIIYNNSSKSSTNIIFDDDIIFINSNNKVSTNALEKNDNMSSFLNKLEESDAFPQNSNIDMPSKSFDNMMLDNIITPDVKTNIISGDKLSNRYNRKFNNAPDESDLIHIRNYDIITQDQPNNNDTLDDIIDSYSLINNNNSNTIKEKNDIDSKIFNKSNKTQKLFKDSKTIAGRFTKNSIIEDYKNELDYYEKLRTPWWVSDAKFD